MTSPFAFLEDPTDAPVLIDAQVGRVWTQDELADAVRSTAQALRTDRRELIFCVCRGDVASIVAYLSSVYAGHAVALIDASAGDELIAGLAARYRPAFTVRSNGGSAPAIRRSHDGDGPTPGDGLAVLLSTSGTTGSPKFVRLAHRNVEANATAIAEYLAIDLRERAILSLPIHYSYGLSVLNSHLAAGAPVIVTPHSIMRPEFWADAARWGATSFAGVPQSYAILERTGLLRSAIPETMRTLTQAGGRMAPESVVRVHRLMSERGGRLFVMYGQTEATARISYVPPEALPEKADTIGIPIPGGRLTIRSGEEQVLDPGTEGELIYEGPNVMLGYAEHRDDLALGDSLHGELATGDLGSFDRDGFFRLTGRSKRIAKVFGLRVNLDEIEVIANAHGPAAATEDGEKILLWRVASTDTNSDDVRREVARRVGLNSRAVSVRDVDELLLKPSGKVDYDRLVKLGAG